MIENDHWFLRNIYRYVVYLCAKISNNLLYSLVRFMIIVIENFSVADMF